MDRKLNRARHRQGGRGSQHQKIARAGAGAGGYMDSWSNERRPDVDHGAARARGQESRRRTRSVCKLGAAVWYSKVL